MDLPIILIKTTGIILFCWTSFSIFKHFKTKWKVQKEKNEEVQSISEQILNNLLLYLWLAFMIVFSSGMILNN